jgi:hypothetical protein
VVQSLECYLKYQQVVVDVASWDFNMINVLDMQVAILYPLTSIRMFRHPRVMQLVTYLIPMQELDAWTVLCLSLADGQYLLRHGGHEMTHVLHAQNFPCGPPIWRSPLKIIGGGDLPRCLDLHVQHCLCLLCDTYFNESMQANRCPIAWTP